MAYPSGSYQNGGRSSQRSFAPTDSSAQRLALDNLIRRELKVGDPSDPYQIAQALMTRYKDDPRARAITQEAQGLPFLLSAPEVVMSPAAPTSSDAELQQAKDDVERDIQELTTNSLLKDITPELQGWGQAVRSAITEGANAARFALDPRQRDKTFAIRRQLGDYARLARLVGALTPTLSLVYRKFAQSLDEVASVLLVMMGEALANVGFSGGRFLLQAPYSELQVRRDATIYALRNLIGATQEAYAPNEWPRGLDAYRRLFELLEAQGQGDLRALLVESELARAMDELIQRAEHGRVEGLRALGATAQLDLERFRRLAIVGQRVVVPESPPLTSFLEALQLFADAFTPSGGFRLLRIARPPVLFYGLYGIAGPQGADQILIELIIQRGSFAGRLDCLLQCGCSPDDIRCQILLDKILYDLDRAIDLYALGTEDFGDPERRAAAYAFVIDALLAGVGTPLLTCVSATIRNDLLTILNRIQGLLRPTLNLTDPNTQNLIGDLKDFAGAVLTELNTVPALCTTATLPVNVCIPLNNANTAVTSTTNDLPTLTKLLGAIQSGQERLEKFQRSLRSPESVDSFFGVLIQELCVQRDLEARWQNLVQTMVPGCVAGKDVFDLLDTMVSNALSLVGGTCAPFDVKLPPHYETSLDSIANDVTSGGIGRP